MLLKKITLGIILCLLFISGFSQVCFTSSIVASTPDIRFDPKGNGTVLDTKTHLIWKRCTEGQVWDGTSCTGSASTYTWQGALEAAQALNNDGGFASQTDWRVPNIKELSSLAELQCINPGINLTVFPNADAVMVWSSSSSVSNTSWIINFNFGLTSKYYKSKNLQVRLVRSGQ